MDAPPIIAFAQQKTRGHLKHSGNGDYVARTEFINLAAEKSADGSHRHSGPDCQFPLGHGFLLHQVGDSLPDIYGQIGLVRPY